MITIGEYIQKAYDIDGINISLYFHTRPTDEGFTTSDMCPDYPDIPYRQIYPDATNEEIFEARCAHWVFCQYKYVIPLQHPQWRKGVSLQMPVGCYGTS